MKRPARQAEELVPKIKRKANSLLWLYEPLAEDPRFICQRFFFLDAAHLDGRLYLALVDREEPWSGLLVCTARIHHATLQRDFPAMTPHPKIGKWLYVSRAHPKFEDVAPRLVLLAAQRDPRLGVEIKRRKGRARSA